MHSWAIGCSDLRHLVLLQHYKRPKLFCLLLGLRQLARKDLSVCVRVCGRTPHVRILMLRVP
jgi:hypothetical protein